MTLHVITLSHYITLRCITLPYITLHYITFTSHYITLHHTTSHYITLHYTTLHYTTLHEITLHYITLHYITYIHTVVSVNMAPPCRAQHTILHISYKGPYTRDPDFSKALIGKAQILTLASQALKLNAKRLVGLKASPSQMHSCSKLLFALSPKP